MVLVAEGRQVVAVEHEAGVLEVHDGWELDGVDEVADADLGLGWEALHAYVKMGVVRLEGARCKTWSFEDLEEA